MTYPRAPLFAIGIFAASLIHSQAATTLLAGWDFQGGTSGTSGSVIPAIVPAASTFTANAGSQMTIATLYLNGSFGSSSWGATQVDSVSGTALNAAAGMNTMTTGAAALSIKNSSANTFSVVFSVSTTGYESLVLSYATNRSSTGFTGNQWLYSTDGTSFTSLGATGVVSPGSTSFAVQTIDFGSIPALNNAASVYLKYTVVGASSAGGSNHLDNIQINATAIPEPSWTLGLLGGVGLMAAGRRKRSLQMRS